MGSVSLNVEVSKFLAPDAQRAGVEEGRWRWRTFSVKCLEEGLYTDIRLNACGGSVRAHRCVLAHGSPVFNAMFRHKMKEYLTSTVELPEMTIEGLQLFLLLLYIDFPQHSTTPILGEFQGAVDEHFIEIFEACHKYQVTILIAILNDALPRNLTSENCWDCLEKSTALSRFCDLCPFDINPASICRDFILDNCEEVMTSDQVLHEMQRNPESVHTTVKSLTTLVMTLLPKNHDNSTPSVSSLWHRYKNARTG
ncbi:hypothetical protein M758_3G043700 [Ceratodon purpureus]|nr:hypothetical protein M758_3G043700 [Ceratodon purpureus]